MRTVEEIRKELEDTHLANDVIKLQLQEAKGYTAETGDYSDNDWFNRATFAAKSKGRKIQKLQAELGEALKAEKLERMKSSDERSKVFERAFIYNASKLLPTDLYQMVLQKTISEVPQ